MQDYSLPMRLFNPIPITFIFSLLLLMAMVTACDLVNPEEDIPAYIYVEPFEVQINSGREGSASARISEVWLSVDGTFLGAYPLPATIPILTPGPHDIRLEPGIRDNGISSSPEIYPFYTPFETTVDLTINQTDTIRPVTRYTDEATFIFNEPFEVSDHLFRDVILGNPVINGVNRTDIDPFEGNTSGQIRLDATNPEVVIATNRRFLYPDNFNFPTVYLEVNYKSEALVGFGIIGYNNANPNGRLVLAAGFRPRDEWNKIYFNLSQIFADNNFFEFQVVFQAAIPQDNGTYIQENASIWLDNIKLIRF